MLDLTYLFPDEPITPGLIILGHGFWTQSPFTRQLRKALSDVGVHWPGDMQITHWPEYSKAKLEVNLGGIGRIGSIFSGDEMSYVNNYMKDFRLEDPFCRCILVRVQQGSHSNNVWFTMQFRYE